MTKAKACPSCQTSPMEPYAVGPAPKRELLYRCNECGFKEGEP